MDLGQIPDIPSRIARLGGPWSGGPRVAEGEVGVAPGWAIRSGSDPHGGVGSGSP